MRIAAYIVCGPFVLLGAFLWGVTLFPRLLILAPAAGVARWRGDSDMEYRLMAWAVWPATP